MKHLQHTFQDSFEKQGLWWLPDEPDNEIGGQLVYHPADGIHLELAGSFRDQPTNEMFEANIILGVTSDGIECTLFENWANDNLAVPGYFRQNFRSQCLFLGHHFHAGEDLRFHAYAVNFEYLEEWIDRSPYSLDSTVKENRQLEYNLTWSTRVILDSLLETAGGRIQLNTSLDLTENAANALRIQSDAFVKWEPSEPEDFDQCRRRAYELQHLLTLLIGESTFPRRAHGFVKRELRSGIMDWPVAVLYRLPNTLSPSKMYHHEMLVPFPAIAERFAVLADRWLANAEKLRPVYDLFFSSLSKPDMYLENRFLNLVHALESYHRVMVGGQYLPSEDYKEYYSALMEHIASAPSKGLRQALSDRLRYGNEFSLRRRLKDIFRELGDELSVLVTEEYKGFVDSIVNARNDLVHHGTTEVMVREDMLYACQRLRVLLTVLLLQTLGLESLRIKEAVANSRGIQPWDEKKVESGG